MNKNRLKGSIGTHLNALTNREVALQEYGNKYPKEYRNYCRVNGLKVKDKHINYPIYLKFKETQTYKDNISAKKVALNPNI